MSAPSANLRTGTVLGVALGLALIFGSGYWLYRSSAGRVDAAQQMSLHFAGWSLPGYTSTAAQVLSGGATIVSFERDGSAPEAPMPAAPDGKVPERDWRKVAIPAPQSAPVRVAFQWYPPESSAKVAQAALEAEQAKELRELPPEGGLVRIDVGKLAWSGYDADFVHDRRFAADASFQDRVRVNLSVSGSPCLALLSWPRGQAADRAQVLQVLGGLQAKTPAETQKR